MAEKPERGRMKRPGRKAIEYPILGMILGILLVTAVAITAEAKTPRNGKYADKAGHIYILRHGKPRTGWFRYHGKLYYGHKTSSTSYPKGSVTTDAFRIRNGRLYYMQHDGRKMTHSSEFIKLRKGGTSVRYIYFADEGSRWRYNARLHRYQSKDPGTGRWEDVGMQCWPYGQIDAQP